MTQPMMPRPDDPYLGPPTPAPIPSDSPPVAKRSWITSKPVIGLAAGVVGLALGAATARTGASAAGVPAPTTTVTVTATATYEPEPSEQAADSSTFSVKKSDFTLGVKVLSKECFGSAGCNVTFRIKPTYVGSQDLPDTGTVEVSYAIKGGEEPLSNTFTVQAGEVSYDSKEFISTRTSSAKLSAVVTDVEYNEW